MAAINSNPQAARYTLWEAGGVIAYNLIRFDPLLEVSDNRSGQIFVENMI